MLEEFSAADDRAAFESDVCIVGAGAAGITLARRLVSLGIDVLILESGAADYEKPLQDLGAGESIGSPYYRLDQSRLRLFGGTTAVWGGRVVQLDAIDFERRPWIAHSGWPFGKQTLESYYAESQRALDLEAGSTDERLWRELGLSEPGFDPSVLRTNFFQFDEQFERFTLRRCEDLVQSPKVRILLRATAVEFCANGAGTAVEAVRIGNLQGGRGLVRARIFVLAAGGLETPRILLASTAAQPRGLGNGEDLVGRFFMEHPHARTGRVLPWRLWRLLHLLPRSHRRRGLRYSALVRPSEVLQEKEAILNSSYTLTVRRHPGRSLPPGRRLFDAIKWKVPHDHRGRSAWWAHRRAKQRLAERAGIYLRWLRVVTDQRGLYVVTRAEQSPNPDSRVRLTNERDALGMPRIALDWRLLEIDKRSLAVSMAALDRELQRLSLGRVEPSPWLADPDVPWQIDPLISNHPIGGYHHMGTTRMAASPRCGVVDSDCRVHGLGNLYIAGSSVFPTSGWANPTLTILALALRLGDHLGRALSPARSPGS